MGKWLASSSAIPTPDITTATTLTTTTTTITTTSITNQPNDQLKAAPSSTTQARFLKGANVSV